MYLLKLKIIEIENTNKYLYGIIMITSSDTRF